MAALRSSSYYHEVADPSSGFQFQEGCRESNGYRVSCLPPGRSQQRSEHRKATIPGTRLQPPRRHYPEVPRGTCILPLHRVLIWALIGRSICTGVGCFWHATASFDARLLASTHRRPREPQVTDESRHHRLCAGQPYERSWDSNVTQQGLSSDSCICSALLGNHDLNAKSPAWSPATSPGLQASRPP